MNITITVMGDTDSPDVQNLLAHLAKTIPATIVAGEPVKPEVVKESPKSSRKSTPVVEAAKTTEEVANQEKQLGETVVKQEQENAQAQPPKHSAEQVRAAAVKKSGSGKREEVKALIESFGTPNLAGLKPEQFDAFMEKLEAI